MKPQKKPLKKSKKSIKNGSAEKEPTAQLLKIIAQQDNITHIESIGHYKKVFYIKEKPESIKITKTEILVQLGKKNFLDCHRRFILNMSHVSTFYIRGDGLVATLSNDDEVPITEKKKKTFKKKAKDFPTIKPYTGQKTASRELNNSKPNYNSKFANHLE